MDESRAIREFLVTEMPAITEDEISGMISAIRIIDSIAGANGRRFSLELSIPEGSKTAGMVLIHGK